MKVSGKWCTGEGNWGREPNIINSIKLQPQRQAMMNIMSSLLTALLIFSVLLSVFCGKKYFFSSALLLCEWMLLTPQTCQSFLSGGGGRFTPAVGGEVTEQNRWLAQSTGRGDGGAEYFETGADERRGEKDTARKQSLQETQTKGGEWLTLSWMFCHDGEKRDTVFQSSMTPEWRDKRGQLKKKKTSNILIFLFSF